MSGSAKLSVFFNEASQTPAFAYGWCRTDHKSGMRIRLDYRTDDFMYDAPYKVRVRAMLKKLGLPWPKREEIFRGTHHDLLFLNSHGVVVRIGPTDVREMINPGILQPLGWLEDRSIRLGDRENPLPLTVAVYPGIELYTSWRKDRKAPALSGLALEELLTMTGHATNDLINENMGIIRIPASGDGDICVPVVLDVDNKGNALDDGKQRKKDLAAIEKLLENKNDILPCAMDKLFTDPVMDDWKRAFEVHEPLRLLFRDAFSDVAQKNCTVDPAARARFWDACARVTNKPQSAIMPLWKEETGADGKKRFVRKEAFVPQVVLYRPWTGLAADGTVYPASVDPDFVEKVKNAHAAVLEAEAVLKTDPVAFFALRPVTVPPAPRPTLVKRIARFFGLGQ